LQVSLCLGRFDELFFVGCPSRRTQAGTKAHDVTGAVASAYNACRHGW